MSQQNLFFSKLLLNPHSREVLRDLRDPYQLHRTLSRAWGEGDEYEQARVLFRVESAAEHVSVLLVQSQRAPAWDKLPSKYFHAAPQTKEWQPAVQAGQMLAFRLRANPTVKRDGKRWGLYRESEQLEWIGRKALQHGFELGQVTATKEGQPQRAPGRTKPNVQFWRDSIAACPQRDKGNVLTERTAPAVFCAARFDGILCVKDVEVFLHALHNGVGSAKGFGFGLLSVARA
ncbi:MAG TPA: type I-E CRISPR-associated protein Cas6/Cse3/CasE [Abditibacteriaceae bacterium]|jgi:CRISPR system Cascade subunit CasE